MLRRAWFSACVLLAPLPATAQVPADTGASARDSALRVFFDCPGYASGCDFDFLRTELTWVNWVRNREDADVHALVTTQSTGGGGDEYTISLIGLRRFSARVDTLHFFTTGTSTRDEDRRGLVRILALGLASYAAATPLADRLSVSFGGPAAGQAPPPTIRGMPGCLRFRPAPI